MPIYDVLYHDGPKSNSKKRVTIVSDENHIEDEIYNRPEAKQYSDVIWSIQSEGIVNYIVAAETEGFYKGKRDSSFDGEEYLSFKANNKSQIREYYEEHFYGKYVAEHRYYPGNVLLDKLPVDIKQCIRFGKIVDIYEGGNGRIDVTKKSLKESVNKINLTESLSQDEKSFLLDLIDELDAENYLDEKLCNDSIAIKKDKITQFKEEYSDKIDDKYIDAFSSLLHPKTWENLSNYNFDGNRSFWDSREITHITIPNSVTSIGDCVFWDCKSLQSITLPASVTSISDYAFWDCKSLQSITLPAGVTSIGEWAFNECIALKSITIPNSVTSIGDHAFSDCKSLQSIILEKGIDNEIVNQLKNEYPQIKIVIEENLNESLLIEAPEKHDTLNPKLWDIETNTLKPEVKEKIMQIVKDFCDDLENDEIKFNLKDVKLVGSNCSYNYNDKSDLDIHLVMDTKSLKCPDNLYPLLYSAYRSIWNKNHDIDFYGIPVEIFVETDDTEDLNN